MAKVFELVAPHYKNLRVAPAAAKSAGAFDTYGSLNGFYLTDISATEVAAAKQIILIVEAEQVKVAKTTAQAWVPGEPLYYDPVTSKVTNVAGALSLIGYVREPAALNDTSGIMIFDGAAEHQAFES